MPEKILYEYAVVRLVPNVEREEFINVGIILFSKGNKFLKIACQLDEERLKLFSAETDVEQLKINLCSFEKICKGLEDGGPIAKMDLASRFRWLTATRSASIQTSRPHSGLSCDLDNTLERLYAELVL
ncbi:DUF3037 domain-containing protein [Zunongwangia sp. F363]|uniref:DUF3037 domain-containing protein n=1 Tax=Autumnicola tepida TaxID=3075595 RepID=A0ABU3CEA4_9FLAO|nr:DUF3037 domain-containing protein [Zunongwangia sp. F363]MDT0644679.1 DUF3037 domain-containing protein [Zunongwangia sp. F363]